MFKEDIYIPSNGLGVPRSKMPQIKSDHVMDFFSFLQSQGIPVIKKTIKVSELNSTQKEFNLDKIKKMLELAPEDALLKPIISSIDNYILDGHHRWLTILNKHKDYMIDTYQVQCDIKTLLKLANNAPMVTYKTIYESLTEKILDEAKDYKKFTITACDMDDELEKLLNSIKNIGNQGHGFDIIVDPDAGKESEKFYWDGDGPDTIKTIEVEEMDEEQFYNNKLTKKILEDITLDIDKGDTIKTGKFKNHKVVVDDIGEDEHGMPTVNGKQITKIRIPKNDPLEKDNLAEAIIKEAEFIEPDKYTFDQNVYGFIIRDMTTFRIPEYKIKAVKKIEDAKKNISSLPTVTLDPSMLMAVQGEQDSKPFAVKLNRVYYLLGGKDKIRQMVKDRVKTITINFLDLDLTTFS